MQIEQLGPVPPFLLFVMQLTSVADPVAVKSEIQAVDEVKDEIKDEKLGKFTALFWAFKIYFVE